MIKAKSFTKEQVVQAVRAGRTVVVLDSGSHGDDDLFLVPLDLEGDATVEEAMQLMAEHLEVDECPEDYEFRVASYEDLEAILWDAIDSSDYDEVEQILEERKRTLCSHST